MQRRFPCAAGEEHDFVFRVIEVDRLLRPRAAPGMGRLVGRVGHALQPGGAGRHQPVEPRDGARRHDHPGAVARGLAELFREVFVGERAHRGDDQVRARFDDRRPDRAQRLVSRRLDHDVGLDGEHRLRVVPHRHARIGRRAGAHQNAVEQVERVLLLQAGDDKLADGAIADKRKPHRRHPAASIVSPRWQMPLK